MLDVSLTQLRDDQAISATRKRRKPQLSNSLSRRPMTLVRLRQLLRDGFGAGRDEAYRPWIRVTRSTSSPISHTLVAATPIHARGIHLLSKLESTAANVACWLGATEIREQFPLFPWEGLHPMSGLDEARDRFLGNAPALLDIAHEAGIPIGHYVGTNLPFVATTDLVLRVGTFPHDRLVFWSCKPLAAINHDKTGHRVLERLELERRYAVGVGARHVVFTDQQITAHLRKNLLWFKPPRSYLLTRSPEARHPFTSAFNALDLAMPLATRIKEAAARSRAPLAEAQADFRAAAWLGEIDIDLTQQVAMTYPARRDLTGARARLRATLLGDA